MGLPILLVKNGLNESCIIKISDGLKEQIRIMQSLLQRNRPSVYFPGGE